MYPERDREVTVVETTTELERQVSRARQAVQQYTSGVLASVRSGVSSVIHAEDKVEGTLWQTQMTYFSFRDCVVLTTIPYLPHRPHE